MALASKVSINKLLSYSITRHPFHHLLQQSIPNLNNNSTIDHFHHYSTSNPPEPIPNRPLRGERPPISRRDGSPPPPPSRFERKNLPREAEPSSRIPNTSRDHFPGEHSFLERFKLSSGSGGGDDEAKISDNQNNPETTTKAPETETKVSPDSPPEDADEIFKKMKETGLIPNAVAMLDGLCKDGLVQEAMKLFGLMRDKGTIPEVVIYTAVVDGFCKANKPDDAKRIFRKMQTNGISPNAFSYGVFINGLCKGKRLDDAVDFSLEMLDAGHSPNVSTFVALIDTCCQEKGVEEAQGIITRLREKGFFLNEKAVREHLDKKGSFSSLAWEAIFGKKNPQKMF